MASTWQFVDSIGSSPTVRLDLNTLTGIFLAEDPEVSPPTLRRVTVSSMLLDGQRIPASAYDNRMITLKLHVSATTADLLATSLQNLARELQRPEGNFLRVTVASNPMFFRTFPAPDAAFLIMLTKPTQSTVTVQIPCEPFGYGVKEILSNVTVTNNPAAASNGQFFDVTSPKGDVETPLDIKFANGTAGFGATGRLRSALAVRRRGTVANVPFFLQAEAMTMGTNAAIQATNAAFSGATNNFVKVTPGTTTMVSRLTTTTKFPSTASTDARGTYRAFMRLRQATGTDVWDVRLNYGSSSVQYVGDTVRCPTDVGAGAPTLKYIDLGLIPIPVGYDPVNDGLSGVAYAAEGLYFDFQAARVSGTGTLDLDVLVLLPADDRLEFIKFPEVQNFSTDTFTAVGGPAASVYCLNTSNQVSPVQAIEIGGSGLMITPGRTNRVYYMRDVGTGTSLTGSGDSITATAVLTPSYYPRYLFPLKPVST